MAKGACNPKSNDAMVRHKLFNGHQHLSESTSSLNSLHRDKSETHIPAAFDLTAVFLDIQEEARLLIEGVRQYELCRVVFPIAVLHEQTMQSVVTWTRAARRSCNLVG